LFLHRGWEQIKTLLQTDVAGGVARQKFEVTGCGNPTGIRRVVEGEGVLVAIDFLRSGRKSFAL
jgi:hypothetical protein